MGRKLHRIGCMALAFVLLACSFVPALYVSADSEYTTICFYGNYFQTEARSMRDEKINVFRRGDEAWWYSNENMVDKTYPASELCFLEEDPDLERIAMQRAAEISILFSHTRPNGQPYSSAYEEGNLADVFKAKGENIAAGTDMDMEAAFEAWKEDDFGYSGQGHRRNMLSDLFRSIGIAHVEIDGIDYWVQEFGTRYEAASTFSSPFNGKKKVTVQIKNDSVASDPTVPPEITPPSSDDVTIEFGTTVDPPYAMVTYIPKGLLSKNALNNSEKKYVLSKYSASGESAPDKIDLPDGAFLQLEETYNNLNSTYTSDDSETVFVDGNGNLEGKKLGHANITISSEEHPTEVALDFRVNVIQRDISNATITFPENVTYEFCGRDITPEPTVVCDGRTLIKGTDYNLKYSDNRNAGPNAAVIVEGTGNYKGSKTAHFTINPLSIEGAQITLEYESTPYTGQARTPALVSMETDEYKFVVEVPNRAGGMSGGADPTVIPIRADEDYDITYSNNIAIGKALATVIGKGNLTSRSNTGEFSIVKTQRGDALILLEYATTEYDGTEKKPKVTVDVDGTALKAGTDFKVTYSDNTDAGEAKVKVEGLNSFSEIKETLDFKITPRSIEDAEVTPEYTAVKYTGSEFKPEVTVTLDDEELEEDEDYTVKYSDNKEAGTAKITVTGKGNYTGKALGSFTITSPCEHSWGTGVVTKAATCKEKGVKTFTCSKCGETKTEEINLADHTPGAAATCNTPQKCLVCGAQMAAATGKHSDANSDGKCDVCGAGVPVTNPLTSAGNPVVYQSTPTTVAAPVSAAPNANAGSTTVYQYDTPNPDTGFGSILLERMIQIAFLLSLTVCLTVIPSRHSGINIKKKK